MFKNRLLHTFVLLAIAVVLRFVFGQFLHEDTDFLLRVLSLAIILIVGTVFVLRGTAKIIEETTEILSERTKLAGGLLQSFGTAFPDMVLGILAAFISVSLRDTDYEKAVNFAIIAAATTFGSNIYNISHAAWCIYRQNLANIKNKKIFMFPKLRSGGLLTPMKEHRAKLSFQEIDTAMDVLVALTLLTAIVAVSMVMFGRVTDIPEGFGESLYQLIRPAGIVILLLCVFTLYFFRKNRRSRSPLLEEEERYFGTRSNGFIWLNLLLSGGAILLAAEAMVRAIEVFSEMTHVPFVVAGVLAGLIGCLGEMIVIHNFSVHPRGRLGDAVMGVAMDNIVTTMGASVVAIMGGIFLGSNALIIIFVIILMMNTVLMWQISKLKTTVQVEGAR